MLTAGSLSSAIVNSDRATSASRSVANQATSIVSSPSARGVAVNDMRVEDGRHVADEIAVWIGHPELLSAGHTTDAGELHDDAGLLGRLADRGLHWRFVRLDRPTNRLPQTCLGLANQQQTTLLVPRKNRDRREQHQVVTDPLAQAPYVRRDAHSGHEPIGRQSQKMPAGLCRPVSPLGCRVVSAGVELNVGG